MFSHLICCIYQLLCSYRMESYLRKEFLLRHERRHDKELISKAEEANQFKTIFLANVVSLLIPCLSPLLMFSRPTS